MSDIRRALLSGLKEQLSKGCVFTSHAQNNRNQAIRILFNRMERMSDNMMLDTSRVLSEIAALDMTAPTGTLVPGGLIPIEVLGLRNYSPRVGWSRAGCLGGG
jgi:hypothetical protein